MDGKVLAQKMIILKIINKIYLISFTLLCIFLYSQKIICSENAIIFKLKDKAYTTLDLEMRLEYLDFVGNNIDLDEEIVINDFISAILFLEYYKDINIKDEYNERINEIFENILEINKSKNKIYKYKINKKNILYNIRLDFIRKTILERIIKSNINELNSSNEEIDLLYKFNLKYINADLDNNSVLKNKIKNLINPEIDQIIKYLEQDNINYFLKEREINNINKVDTKIKEKILSNENYIYLQSDNKITLIFIEKKFETFEDIIITLYSLRSEIEMDEDDLKCLNLKKNNNESLIKKDYNFLDLNNELKKNLLNINDLVKIKNNNQNIYIVLCDIKFDRTKLDNMNLNKLINKNVNIIEKKFINKYSKIYNLKLNEF